MMSYAWCQDLDPNVVNVYPTEIKCFADITIHRSHTW